MNWKWKRPEAILFDLDGTLFQTETLLLPAYHRTFDTLREEGLFSGETPPEQRILESLGLLLRDIWKNVAPDSSERMRERANELLLKYQLEGLREGIGELYPGVKETLAQLHERGVRLFVASNGLEAYVKGVVKHMGIAPYFEALYSAGEFRTESKVQLVRLLLDRYRIEAAWMVGDRSSDVEASKQNGLDVIGCRYAQFGKKEELSEANAVIHSFPELLHFLAD